MTKEAKRNKKLGSMTRHTRPNRHKRAESKGITRYGIILEDDRAFVPAWMQFCDLKARA